MNKRIPSTAWTILIALFSAALACTFVQDRLANFTGQSTATRPSGSPPAGGTQPAATLTLAAGTTQLASTEVHTPFDFNSLASTLDWTYSGAYTSLQVPVSGDLQAAAPLDIAASSLSAPEKCLQRQDCRHEVAIEISDQVAGVDCTRTEQVLWKETCAEATIQPGTRFRLRGILYDTHPGQWNYITILQILPPSDAACQEGQLRCAADSTCFADFDDYCRTCLGQEKENCACQSPEGNKPNGSDCQYWLSGDVLQSGKCWFGTCR